MGSASSKVGRSAAGAAKRQYPQRASPAVTSNPAPAPQSKGPTVKPEPQISETRTSNVDRDAQDPDFAASLRSIGPVQPRAASTNPFDAVSQAPSGSGQHQRVFPDRASNPALKVLEARNRLAREAEEEAMRAGRGASGGDQGRRFLDVMLIRQILQMRDQQGVQAAEIERRLELRSGTLARLGPKGVVGQIAI